MSFLRSNLAKRVAFVFAALLILLLFYCIRIHTLNVYKDNGEYYGTVARTERAMKDARNILSGRSFGTVFQEGYDDKGFALLVALGWKISGDQSVDTIRWMTIWMDAVALVALGVGVWKVFGFGPALIASLLYAVYIPVAVEISIVDIQVYPVQFSIVLLCLFAWFPKRTPYQVIMIVVMSLLAILASMVRGTFALFPLVLATCLFLKWGWRRGSALATLLVILSVGGLAFVKTVLKNPTHTAAHPFFLGLVEFPNPYGLKPIDTEAWKVAKDIQRGVDPYTDDYSKIVEARAWTLINESPGFYLRLLGKRAWKVFFGEQRKWWFFGFGAEKGQRDILSWAVFLLFLTGVWLAFREKIGNSFPFLLAFLYFGFIILPLIVYQTSYFLAASVMQLPFAAFALSRVRLAFANQSSQLPAGTPGANCSWKICPYSARFLLRVLPLTVVFVVVAVFAVLQYAHYRSKVWCEDFLEKVQGYDLVEEWPPVAAEQMVFGTENPVTSPVQVERGTPYLFHSVLEIKRGRVGLQVCDKAGKKLSDVTFSSRLGRIHCFTGWFARSDSEAVLHVWDPLPYEPTATVEDTIAETIAETYRHYNVEDHAKYDYFPENKVQVSSTLFPNGHESLPFKINKLRWGVNETIKIPGYWAGSLPCSATLTLAHEPVISQILLINNSAKREIPTVSVRPQGRLFSVPLPTETIERGGGGKILRFFFQPLCVSEIAVRFDSTPGESEIVYLKDLSLPDAAEFEVVKTSLYRLSQFAPTGQEEPEGSGYPTHLSFMEP